MQIDISFHSDITSNCSPTHHHVYICLPSNMSSICEIYESLRHKIYVSFESATRPFNYHFYHRVMVYKCAEDSSLAQLLLWVKDEYRACFLLLINLFLIRDIARNPALFENQ